MTAWNNWYHVNGTTYGMWLPGDARGWREKNHRKHVEGDYKHPPPEGTGEKILRRSKDLLKHPPVKLTKPQRQHGGRALVESLLSDNIELLSLSLDGVPYHFLARFPDHRARYWTGRAKLHAYFALRKQFPGVKELWTKLCAVHPIVDREHQINVFNYILAHQNRGAWTWSFRDAPGL